MRILLLLLLLLGNASAKTYFTPGKECEEQIVKSISKTKNSLDIAIYSITNEAITEAIIEAHKKGIKVRVLTDYVQARGKYSKALHLKENGVNIRLNSKNKIEHNKFTIFDQKVVETGSYNYTYNATNNNSENCHFLRQKTDVQKYQRRFNWLWKENSAEKSEERFEKMRNSLN